MTRRRGQITAGNGSYAPDAQRGRRCILSDVNARSAASGTHRTGAAGLRNPLATARPGLDYLRSAFVAEWHQHGSLGSGPAAQAYAQAVAGTPEATTDDAAIARWIGARFAASAERAMLAN